MEVPAFDMPRQGIDTAVRDVLDYIEANSGQLSRVAVDFIADQGYSPYNLWPTDFLDHFTNAVIGDPADRETVRAAVVFNAVTGGEVSTVRMARAVVRMTAMQCFAESLERFFVGRDVTVTGG